MLWKYEEGYLKGSYNLQLPDVVNTQPGGDLLKTYESKRRNAASVPIV